MHHHYLYYPSSHSNIFFPSYILKIKDNNNVYKNCGLKNNEKKNQHIYN